MSDECPCEVCTTFKDFGVTAFVVPPKPPPTFEDRVVALAVELSGAAPLNQQATDKEWKFYSWSQALADATDIILAADLNIDGECTCD